MSRQRPEPRRSGSLVASTRSTISDGKNRATLAFPPSAPAATLATKAVSSVKLASLLLAENNLPRDNSVENRQAKEVA